MIARGFQIDGSNTRELDFEQPVVNIGSHAESDVAIPGEGIMPFHATVILQDGAFHLTRLSPEARVSVDGIATQAEMIVLKDKQYVAIGTYTISFARNGSPTGMHVSVTAPGTPAGSAVPASLDNTILVNILSQHTQQIQVTQSAVYELEVVNAGHIVAGFAVSLQGVPAEWIEITPQTFNLNEHQRATVTVTITPPRDPSSTAGRHSLGAIISSPNYPGAHVATPLDLIIEPYCEFSLGNLTPKQQNIFWRKGYGTVRLPITNRGNGPADFAVLALDDENGCSFDFQIRDDLQLNRQATFNVEAGSTLNLPIDITPLKRPVFSMRNKRYQYTTTVNVAQQAVSQQVVSGSVTNHPLFGWWSIVLSVAAILLGLFILVQPRIQNFSVAANKDVIELGDTTRLEWKVSPFATRVNISNVEETLARGQNSLTVAPGQSTTYELVAGNWLSGLLGLDQKRIQTVLVVPPSPRVNVFEVDNTAVARGKAVNVRWSVTQADKAVLTIGGVVYELSPEKFSGEQSVVLDKDSLVTLDASNASGNELRSYFINVMEPLITVRSFVVWVRPKAAASIPADRPVLAAIRPDPFMGVSLPSLTPPATDDFIEKYVELIPDQLSDLGYRVEFHQPSRELSKGEQVMVEWDVAGTDAETVEMAPFTEILPSRGRQPYFPQESMNFVLTAQSGDQKKLYMLPVVVYDGLPPAAPKIDIFKASPMSMVGRGNVQFTWSISGEWTRIELSNGKGVVARNLNPEGSKSFTVSNSDTFVLKAWNGTLSSSQALDITVNPALRDPGLFITSTFRATGVFLVGGNVTVTIGFPPDLTPLPTGVVTVTDGTATCPISLPALSCSLEFTTPSPACSPTSSPDTDCPASQWETKILTASFPGDKTYRQSTSQAFIPPDPGIIVQSSQVDLHATYYRYGGTTPVSIDSHTFEMYEGLDVIVEVQPRNATLNDNNGKVSARFCDLGNDGEIIESTCGPVFGPYTVMVASASTNGQTAGNGYAKISLPILPTSGSRALFIEYVHANNAIDPASLTQPITVNRAKLLLSLPASNATCTPTRYLNTGTSCRYGLPAGSSDIIFDLNTLDASGTPLLLTYQMAAPQASAFSISTTRDAAGNPTPPYWSPCAVIRVSGTYKLKCTVPAPGLLPETSYTVTYKYNNSSALPSGVSHYYMGSSGLNAYYLDSFELSVLTETNVIVNIEPPVYVGERIPLTGSEGLIELRDNNGGVITPSPSSDPPVLTVEVTGGTDIFYIESETVNCTRDRQTNNKINIKDVSVDCHIYFKHAGTYSLTATFPGNNRYSGSISETTAIQVTKQNRLTAAISYPGSSMPVSATAGEALVVMAALDGPDGTHAPSQNSFPPTALIGRKVLITLSSSSTGCAINGTTGTALEVSVGALSPGDPAPVVNFSITCKTSPGTLGFTLQISDTTEPKDSDDFGFENAVTQSNIPIKEKSNATMTVSVKPIVTAGTPPEMVSGLNISSISNPLYFGQEYSLSVTGSQLAIQYHYTYERTLVEYPCWFGTYCYGTRSDTLTSPVPANAKEAAKAAAIPNPALSVTTAGLDMASNTACSTPQTMDIVEDGVAPEITLSPELISRVEDGWAMTRTTVYRYTVNGTVRLHLQSTPNSCKLVFDNTSNRDTWTNPGSITITAKSGTTNPNFLVSESYSVASISKQRSNLVFQDSSSNPLNAANTITQRTGTNVPITAVLAPMSFDGLSLPYTGTPLPYISGFFDTQFPYNAYHPNTCTASPSAGYPTFPYTSTVNSIVVNFTSATSITCPQSLRYHGNLYFYGTTPDLPTITFVNPATTANLTITPSLSGSPFPAGTTVTLTADVTNGVAGSVQFYNNGVALGTPVSVSGGTAQLQVTDSGSYSITATFTPTDTTLYDSSSTSTATVFTIQT